MTPLYKVLGYCGMIPLLAFTIGLYAFDENIGKFLMASQLSYACFLACFLAGHHWGHSFFRSSEGQMICSSIVVIISLFIMALGQFILFGGMVTMVPAKLILSVLFLAASAIHLFIYIYDWQWLDKDKIPQGYVAYRFKLSVIISALLLFSIGGVWLH